MSLNNTEKEKEKIHIKLNQVLDLLRNQFFSEQEQKAYGFRLSSPLQSLSEQVTGRLIALNYFNNDSEFLVKISPSWSLRITCQAQDDGEDNVNRMIATLLIRLAKYGAMSLNEVRQVAADRDIRHRVQRRFKFTISIHREKMIDFLTETLALSPVDLAVHFSRHLAKNPTHANALLLLKTSYERAAITPHFIIFEAKSEHVSRILTLDEADWHNYFGKPHYNGLEKALRHPEWGVDPVSTLMRLLGNPILETSPHYWLTPFPLDYDCQETLPDFNKVIQEINSLITDQRTSNGVQETLNNYIWGIYSALTHDAIALYKQIDSAEIFNEDNLIRRKISTLHNQIGELVERYIFGGEDPNIQTFSIKYWLYLQIAFIAHLKGNFFIATAIVFKLFPHQGTPFCELLSHFPKEFKSAHDIFMNCYFRQNGDYLATKIPAFVEYHIANLGPSIPTLDQYLRVDVLGGFNQENGISMLDEIVQKIKLIPTSSEITYVDKLSKANYSLCLMSDDLDIKENNIYVRVSGNALQYTVINLHGQLIKDTIPREKLNYQINEPYTLENLQPLLPYILQITSKRGHTANITKKAKQILKRDRHRLDAFNQSLAGFSIWKQARDKYDDICGILEITPANNDLPSSLKSILSNRDSLFGRHSKKIITECIRRGNILLLGEAFRYNWLNAKLLEITTIDDLLEHERNKINQYALVGLIRSLLLGQSPLPRIKKATNSNSSEIPVLEQKKEAKKVKNISYIQEDNKNLSEGNHGKPQEFRKNPNSFSPSSPPACTFWADEQSKVTLPLDLITAQKADEPYQDNNIAGFKASVRKGGR